MGRRKTRISSKKHFSAKVFGGKYGEQGKHLVLTPSEIKKGAKRNKKIFGK